MTDCGCRKGAMRPGCDRDDPARRTDSPAFYEERIRLLKAETQRLRAALKRIVEYPEADPTVDPLVEIARAALDGDA